MDWLQFLSGFGKKVFLISEILQITHKLITPPRTPRTSGLKSQVLKQTFFS